MLISIESNIEIKNSNCMLIYIHYSYNNNIYYYTHVYCIFYGDIILHPRTAGYDPTLVILEITVLPIILCS